MTSKAWVAALLLVGNASGCASSDRAVAEDASMPDVQVEAGTTVDGAQPDSRVHSERDAAATTDATPPSDAPPRDAAAPADASKPADAAADATTSTATGCDATGLVWKSGAKTNYESYPAPGSEECIRFNGCAYKGQFQACDNTMPESWVKTHDIAAVFPLAGLALHRLCVRAGSKTIIVTAIDTCGDTDCSGCCSKNRGSADALIDLEKYTNQRFGVEDGKVQWADLGPGDPRFDGCK